MGVPGYVEVLDRVTPRNPVGERLDRTLRLIEEQHITVVTPMAVVGMQHLDPYDQPTCLFVQGNVSLLRSTASTLAVVGARAATAYGAQVTTDLVSWAAELHVGTIISGAAYGIDAAAHRAALAHGMLTVAVLAGGLDRYYPSGNASLIRRIVDDGGAVVSELPPGSPPTKFRFLARNRLIAALSDALVVTEAGFRSGSLNAAGHAQSQGVPLGAVPGSIHSTTSAGCHRLLREYGAQLIADRPDLARLLKLDLDLPKEA
jgi:DNA processing protein